MALSTEMNQAMDNEKIDNIGCWALVFVIVFSFIIFSYLANERKHEKEMLELQIQMEKK